MATGIKIVGDEVRRKMHIAAMERKEQKSSHRFKILMKNQSLLTNYGLLGKCGKNDTFT